MVNNGADPLHGDRQPINCRWLNQIENPRSPISRKATVRVAELRATATAMRGFFLADPNEPSLLPYVEQFAAGDDPAKSTMYWLREGNDRLPERMARALHAPMRLQHAARPIAQNENRLAKSLWAGRTRQAGIRR